MTTNNHTDISSGAVANAATFNSPLGQLDAAIGNLTTLTTTAKTSIVAAINEVDTNADTANASIGALASLDTTDKSSIVAAINEIAALPLNVESVSMPNLIFDPYNLSILPGQNFNGSKKRWADNSTKLQRITGDTNNPFVGGVTLRLPASTVYAGKVIHCGEAGLQAGDEIYCSATVRGASGTCRLYIYWSAAATGGTPTSLSYGQITLDGNVQTVEHHATIPATATRIEVWVYRATGSADIDIYRLAATANNATDYPAPAAPLALRQTNVIFDPLNRYTTVNGSFGGRARWRNASSGVTLIEDDTSNPFAAGNTLRMDAARTYFAKYVYPDECGLQAGDEFTAYAWVNGASGNARIYIYEYDAVSGGTSLGNSDNTVTLDGTVKIIGVSRPITTGCKRVEIWIYRSSGSADIDVYAMFGGVHSPTAVGLATDEALTAEIISARGSEATIDARLAAIEADTSVLSPYPAQQLAYGRHLLRSWHAALSGILGADGSTQAVIAWIGDSWINTGSRLHSVLKTLLQTEYGNAGAGYCSANTTPAVPAGITRNRAGTWTDHDRTTTPKGYGPDLFDAASTDTSTPASVDWTATMTDAVIMYLQQTGGGEFRYQVDTDGWTTVDTDDTPGLGVVTIGGLSSASHTIEIEIVSAGSAGVVILGIDCRIAGNGVRVHKLGATGSSAASWTAHPDADVLADAMAAFAPNLIAVTLGTNDHSGDIAPATFATSVETLITASIGTLDAQAIIMAPADNGNTAAYEMQDYIDALRSSATGNGYAMFDSLLLLGTYTAANARGLYDDASHINATAGRIICGVMTPELLDVL